MIPQAMQHCTQCGSDSPAGSRFCKDCGAPSAATGFTNFTRVRQLFDQAQSIAPAQRDAWLVNACQDDPVLLAELRSMVLTSPHPSFLEQPAAIPPSMAPASTEPSGNFIGPYRVLRELGRGGMGVVYLAMRDDGTFRKNVAIKLLLRDQVTTEFVQRFKQERQVVAALDHPNIARILDAGDTSGMPYYVMEYVEGVPLDQYCDQQRLSLSGRIKVFQQMCHAVHYLHQNLIVHRDLKPSNVLVSTDGMIKLLDFGIAKMVGAASLSAQELTGAQGRPMTPTYASPEQLQGVTPQRTSDIYSMGVILYRLITGRQPYENFDDKVARLASREDPPLPSANIRQDLRATPESTAQRRRATMGALDSIILMAMRYDPKERYQSAADFANDLQRFLDGESLTAYREPVAVRSMKLLKRKRAAIAVLAGFLVLGSFGAWQWERAEKQKAVAAHAQAQLRGLMDQLETRAAAAHGKPNPAEIRDVRQLKRAFATDFTTAVAVRPGNSPERTALLGRGIRYLDTIREAGMLDTQFSLEIADAYEQLGVLQDKTSGGKDRQAALATYYKAADILTGIYPANAGNATVRAQLDRLNQRIASMGGSSVEVAHGLDQEKKSTASADSPTGVVKAAKVPVRPTPLRTEKTADANESTAGSDPPAPPPQAPAPSTIAPAERRELENRVIDVRASIDSAEQAMQPYRDSLAATGQTLSPDLTATMTRMHAALERANRDISDGDAAAAKEDLAAAAALAAKVLHAVGR
jgi:serine/threonine protein kinase